MLVANFMRFRRKRLEKQTHIDNFSSKKMQHEFIWLLCLMSFGVSKKQENPYTKIAK